MRKGLTAAQRLALLLPPLNEFLNGPRSGEVPADLPRWSAGAAEAIGRFLAEFDGSPGAAHVEVVPHGEGLDDPQAALPLSLWRWFVALGTMLSVGFSGPDAFGMVGSRTCPMPSLRFGVRNMQRPDVKRSTLTRRERQDYTAPGAFVLQVSGTSRDLVLYLVLHLLTAEGVAGMLARCPAPAPNDWLERCGRWFLRTGHGRKREYCTDKCRVRHHAKKNAEIEHPRGRNKR